jgi:general secretion pathway protein G
MARSPNRRRGFTLVEVLLVLMILVFMASLAVMAYGPIQRQWRVKAAGAQVGLLRSSLDKYELDVGHFPSTLDALQQPPPDLPNPAKWAGPYLDREIPLDPWDHPYQYACPGIHHPQSYDIWSLGPQDGVQGEIGNW